MLTSETTDRSKLNDWAPNAGSRLGWLALVLFTWGAATGRADTLVRTVAYDMGADAYTQGSVPTNNFGSSGVLTTRNQSGNAANNYKVYLRFDLSNSGLDLANATSVTLQFTPAATRNNVGFEFFALPDGLPGDAPTGWTESGLTYANAPGNAPGTTTLTYLTSSPGDENGNHVASLGSLPTFNATAGSAVSFSSALLLDLVRNDANGLVTIALRRTDNGGILQLASQENLLGYAFPTLIIEAAPVPEPSPAALAAGGFLLLLFRFSARWTPHR